MKNRMTFEEIKLQYPEEWVLLGNPVIEHTKVLSGIPITHAKDKREIAEKKVDWRLNFEGATMVFTGEFPKNRRFWL
jgi:hypothetical protein